MSAVGPRPLAEADVRRLGWSAPRYDFGWRVLLGLTGLAQVMGAPSTRLSASFDRWYVSRRNLSLDVRLVALTLAINALGKTRIRQCLLRARAARRRSVVPGTSERPRGKPHVPRLDRRRE
jgi:hypothetical protein